MSPTSESTLADPEQLIADLQRQLAERHCQLSRPWYARVPVAWRLGSEGPLLAYCVAPL
jgi:hypothetical protein